MAKVIALASPVRQFDIVELVRSSVVVGCALALIFAGQSLPL